MSSKRDVRAKRLAIVKAAAKKLRCTIAEIFTRAAQGARNIVVNLNKIPEHVVAFAKEILKSRFRARTPARDHQRYFRAPPCMAH